MSNIYSLGISLDNIFQIRSGDDRYPPETNIKSLGTDIAYRYSPLVSSYDASNTQITTNDVDINTIFSRKITSDEFRIKMRPENDGMCLRETLCVMPIHIYTSGVVDSNAVQVYIFDSGMRNFFGFAPIGDGVFMGIYNASCIEGGDREIYALLNTDDLRGSYLNSEYPFVSISSVNIFTGDCNRGGGERPPGLDVPVELPDFFIRE